MKFKSLDSDSVAALADRIRTEYVSGGGFCIRMYTKKDKLLCTLIGKFIPEIGASSEKMIDSAFRATWRGKYIRSGRMKYGVFEPLSYCEFMHERIDGEFFAFPVMTYGDSLKKDFISCGGLRMMSTECRKGDEVIFNGRISRDTL